MKTLLKVLKWLKNAFLRILSIPAYLLLAVVIVIIALLEIGQTDGSMIIEIIREYKRIRNEKTKSA